MTACILKSQMFAPGYISKWNGQMVADGIIMEENRMEETTNARLKLWVEALRNAKYESKPDDKKIVKTNKGVKEVIDYVKNKVGDFKW